MLDQLHAIGIDIGGGSTKIGLVSAAGVIADRERIRASDRDDADQVLSKYVRAVRRLLDRNPRCRLEGIGVGFPGHIRADNMSGTFGNIPVLDDFPLCLRLSEHFGCTARMENDASAAGIAEAMFGADREAERILLITVGTGVGVAFMVSGQPQVTSGGCLGDAGHLIINFNEPERCRQGCLGCLESVASADALGRVVQRFALQNPVSALATRSTSLQRDPDASDIVHCGRAGDEAAIQMLDIAGRWLGRAAATWSHVFAPSVVLVGGGLSAAGELLLRPMETEARKCGLDQYFKNIQFSLASLGNDAGIIGAASQIFLNHKS